jgi:hypothetical protein
VIRPLLFRVLPLSILILLLVPALVHLTSPWWAPPAARWAVRRFLQADLSLATASFNPFTLTFRGAGGSFRVEREPVRASGDLSRVEVALDLLPFLARRSVRSVAVEVDTLTVALSGDMSLLGLLSTPSAPPRIIPAAASSPPVAQGPFRVERLTLRIQRGILRYARGEKRGEVSMDLDFQGNYERVSDWPALGRSLLRDLAARTAYAFMAERLFR